MIEIPVRQQQAVPTVDVIPAKKVRIVGAAHIAELKTPVIPLFGIAGRKSRYEVPAEWPRPTAVDRHQSAVVGGGQSKAISSFVNDCCTTASR
jgi:hypothetical protein